MLVQFSPNLLQSGFTAFASDLHCTGSLDSHFFSPKKKRKEPGGALCSLIWLGVPSSQSIDISAIFAIYMEYIRQLIKPIVQHQRRNYIFCVFVVFA